MKDLVTPYACAICKKEFHNSVSLVKHNQLRHQLSQPKVTQSHPRKDHELTHTLESHKKGSIEKLFPCSYCGSKYKTRSGAKIHERKHTGEKPYSCKYCSKKFSQSGVSEDYHY